MMLDELDIPKWDVALAAMVSDETRIQDRPLKLDDFRRLAKRYAFRLDDIFETMALLVIHKEWKYTNPEGEDEMIEQQSLNEMFVDNRISDRSISHYDGSWFPAS